MQIRHLQRLVSNLGVLGISERSAVRELFPRARPTLSCLVEELI